MNHVVTTWGGGEAFYYVFNALATLLSSGGFMNNILRLSGIIGVFWVFVLVAFHNALEQAFQWLLWFMVATNLLFLPKATVWIKDPLTFQAPRKVDNVPLVLAVFAGSVSSIGAAMTEKMESVFTLPDYLPYHQTGTVFASRLMMEARHIKITDPEFRANMERFVNRCVVYDAMIGHKYTLKDLQRSNDVWDLVSRQASPLLGFLYREPGTGKKGQIVSCKEGATALQKLWGEQLKEAAAKYGAYFFHDTNKKGQELFLQYLPQSYQLLTKTAGDASKLLQQEMMMNSIIDGSRNKLDELGSGLNYATAKALIQQEVGNRTMGEVSLRLLPIMKAVIEALCYASFIFVMMLSLMPQGYRVLLNYAGVLMWLQIWAPLYAVLNLFMTLYGQYRSSSLIGSAGLTLMNSAGLSHINAHMASMAGWLSWSLPFIAYGIMKGGVGSFMHIAGSLTSSAQGAVGSAAGEAASGNLSLGNVSLGTTAYQNMTAFQRNTAPSSRDGPFEQLLDDGTVRMSQGDGSQIFKSNISAMRIRANSSENFAERAEEQISHQNALLQSQSEEYSVARMEAARQVLNLAHSSAKGQSGSEGYDQSTAFGRNTAVSQALKFSKILQDQYGLSEKQAADLTASLMAGTPKWFGMSADAKASGSSSAGREKTTQDIQNLASEMGVTNSLDESVRTMKDSKFSDSHSREARIAQDIGHTMERAENTREAMSKTQQAIDSYSKLQSFSKTGAFNIDRDDSQELLEFTASQTLQGRRIGIDGAYRLLNTGGYQADAIVAAFRESKWEGIKSQIDSGLSIKTEDDLNTLYRNASLPGKAVHSHVDHAVGKVSGETLAQQGDAQSLNSPVTSPAKADYERQKAHISGEIDRSRGYLSNKEKSMKHNTEQNINRSLVGATAYNAVDGIPFIGESITQPFGGSNFKRPDNKILSDEASLQQTSSSSNRSSLRRKETNSTIKQTDFQKAKK